MATVSAPVPIDELIEESGADLTSQRLRVKLRRELGSLILDLLEDDRTEDVMLNPDGKVWVKRNPEGFVHVGELSPIRARAAMGTVASQMGVEFNANHPILETSVKALGNARLEGLLPPLVDEPCFVLRRPNTGGQTLEDLEEQGVLTYKEDPINQLREQDEFLQAARGKSHGEILRLAGHFQKNMLIVGPTGSGKTTLTNAVLKHIFTMSQRDRVLIIEDTSELQCSVPNHVKLLTTLRISMTDLLAVCMRMVPKRIFVGEVRGKDAQAVLDAWNTGHPGGIATIHANDAKDALTRFETLLRQSTNAPLQREIASAIHLIVFIAPEKRVPAGRKVKEVCAVLGYDGEGYQLEYL